jgi:hypothetical protein
MELITTIIAKDKDKVLHNFTWDEKTMPTTSELKDLQKQNPKAFEYVCNKLQTKFNINVTYKNYYDGKIE